jgi:hypothetical protein
VSGISDCRKSCMSQQLYDGKTITEYLLGTLPEADTARLDELSFTDDDFSDALNAAEKDLIDAYVQGELSGRVLERFESYFLASSLRREAVQFAQTLQEFGEKQHAVQPSAPETKEVLPKTKSAFSTLPVFFNPTLQWGLAFAGSALLIAVALLLFENVRLRQQVLRLQTNSTSLQQRELQLQNELQAQRAERARLEEELKSSGTPLLSTAAAIASFVLTPQVRGTGQVTTVTIPAGTPRVTMRLPLEPNDFATYRVALIDLLTNNTVWQSTTLRAVGSENSKYLSVSFSAALLRPQNYILRVTGVSPTGVAGVLSDYVFRVAN